MEGVREKQVFPEGAAPALGNKLQYMEPTRRGGGGDIEQHKNDGSDARSD